MRSPAKPKQNDTVVEIGCDVGCLTRAIAPEVGKVFAFICRRRCSRSRADQSRLVMRFSNGQRRPR